MKRGRKVDYPFYHTQSMLLYPRCLRCPLPGVGLHPLLPFRHIFTQTWVSLYTTRLYKPKHLCAVWMQPALKFEPRSNYPPLADNDNQHKNQIQEEILCLELSWQCRGPSTVLEWLLQKACVDSVPWESQVCR